MAPSKSRQRALARAKLERQIARRAAEARRRRQITAGVSAVVALAVVVLGGVWLAGGFKSKPPAPADCAWTGDAVSGNLRDVGTPPTKGVLKTGSRVMTIDSSQGRISALLDPARSPCTVASMSYLAGKQFFDNSTCHRLTTVGQFLLQCGDPTGSGAGGPTYHFPLEYVPPPSASEPPASATATAAASATAAPSATAAASASADPSATPAQPTVLYPRGTVAMYDDGTGTSRSQFFIVYKDSPMPAQYTIFGTVTSGLELIDKIAAGGEDTGKGDGKPKVETKITTLTVTDTAPAAPSQTPSAPAGSLPASTTPSTAPSASASKRS